MSGSNFLHKARKWRDDAFNTSLSPYKWSKDGLVRAVLRELNAINHLLLLFRNRALRCYLTFVRRLLSNGMAHHRKKTRLS